MTLHDWIVFLLRQGLFIIPLSLLFYLVWESRNNHRVLVAAFFSFLFQFGVMYSLHLVAFQLGWWRFGGDDLKMLGFPADIWFGGAFLWGPVLYLAFRKLNPLLFVIPNIIVNAIAMPLMSPVIEIGEGWFIGQVLLTVFILVPGQFLARWTEHYIYLPFRAFLLSLVHASVAFLIIPSAIMKAMGGSWADIIYWYPHPVFFIALFLILIFFVIGLSAVQLFVIHGKGTPIPLDHTQKLVTTGLYAYLRNPMQMCTAAIWLILGFLLMNIWVTLAACMAVIFVLGIVRWHHRYDLEERFPEGWEAYKANVPEWIPRWNPSLPESSLLIYNPELRHHLVLVHFLEKVNAKGLSYITHQGNYLKYKEPSETHFYKGVTAKAKALNHINFFWAIISSGLLLLAMLLPMRESEIESIGADEYESL
jgi:protein-S-isoprenylcysteine O-methyltransferase Ste14